MFDRVFLISSMSSLEEFAEDSVMGREDASAASVPDKQMKDSETVAGDDEQAPPPRHENKSHSAVMELVYDRLITSLSTDVALQVHRMIKTGVYPLSDLLSPEDRTGLYPDIYNNGDKTAEAEIQKYSVFRPEQRKRRRLEDVEEKKYFASSDLGQGRLLSLDPGHAMAAIAEQERAQKQQSGTAPVGSTTITETAPAATTVGPITHNNSNKSSTQPPPVVLQQQQQQQGQAHAQLRTQQQQPSHLDIWGKAPPKEPKDMVPCTLCGRQVNTLRYASHLDKCMGGLSWGRRAAMTSGSGFAPGGNATSRGGGLK